MLLKRNMIKNLKLIRVKTIDSNWCPECMYWDWDTDQQRTCDNVIADGNKSVRTICTEILYGKCHRKNKYVNSPRPLQYAYVVREMI